MRIGTDNAAAVDEDRGGAGDLERLAVCAASLDCGGGFGAGHAGLEGVRIQADLRGVVRELGIGIFGRDDVLIVVDKVIKLPEGLGVLVIGASPAMAALRAQGCCSRGKSLNTRRTWG